MSNLLFISHRFPYPPDRGEKIRGWHLLRHLAKSYDVFLGALLDDARDWDHRATVAEFCVELGCFGIDKRWQKLRAMTRPRPGRPLMLDYYNHPGLRAWVADILTRQKIDIVYIFSTAMAPYALHMAKVRRILDMQDIDSEKWRDYAALAAFPVSMVWAREARTLLAYERRAALACERTLLVTEAECRRLEELAPECRGRLDWLEQGVDLDFFSPERNFPTPYSGPEPWLCFVGNMDYRPNADAVIWFAREALPILRRSRPGVGFAIVGANPGPEVRRLAELPGVIVTGRVADVRPYVMHAAVTVAPLRIARGVQNKVLEAMAMGRPVVASPQAFTGLRAEPGRDLLLAEGAEATARTVAQALNGQHPGLGAAARRLVEGTYSWPAQLAKLDAILTRRTP